MAVKSIGRIVCIGGVLAAMVCAPAWAEDWPHWRGPQHNGISRETGWDPGKLNDGPDVLWRKQIGTGFSSMAVSDGRVYATGNTGKPDEKQEKGQKDILWCLDAGTGREIWQHAYPSPLQPKNYEGGPNATPTIDGGRVYAFSKHGHVFCVDAGSGAVVWQRHLAQDYGLEPPNWGFAGSPVIIDDLIVLNAGAYGVALREQDGTPAWISDNGPAGYASAVPYERQGKACAVILGHREVYSVVAATGEVLWKRPWKTLHDENIPDPTVCGDKLFISTGLGTGAALFTMDDGGLRELWSHKELQNWLGSSVVWRGHVYGVDNKDGALKCLDVNTGSVKWSHGGLGVGSLTLAGGRLIALSDKGKLMIAEAVPTDYRELASAQILEGKCWTVPVLANGRIYARNAAGNLVCIDVSESGS